MHISFKGCSDNWYCNEGMGKSYKDFLGIIQNSKDVIELRNQVETFASSLQCQDSTFAFNILDCRSLCAIFHFGTVKYLHKFSSCNINANRSKIT
ncbi:hypothetical protein Fmac_031624 [Flemingia macrophylla]|uniref:Uncharacterized protein n=1 Tax=Flemingia macrophylla TaxID=520843 RepID=A0ABD1L312_9FABA